MKKTATTMMVILLSMSFSWAGSNPELANEINQKMKIDLSDINLDRYEQDYVLVSFQINNGQINIDKIKGSTLELKERIVDRLVHLTINSTYKVDETYTYRFTFEKI